MVKQGNGKSEDHIQLKKMAARSQEVLFSATTVFPFVLFPDTIAIDRTKATVTRRAFFRVAEVVSIQISDLLNIEQDIGPFFGSLKIYTRFFVTNPLIINFLSRKDTREAKRILQGYMIAQQKMIDCDSIPKDELIPLLIKLGAANN